MTHQIQIITKSYKNDTGYDLKARLETGKTTITPGQRIKIYRGVQLKIGP
jgi:dUTPase